MDAAGEGSAGHFASTEAPCTIETDRGPHSAEQRFYRCRLFADAGKDCGFTQWLDEEFPEQATKHISSLMGSVGCLEKQVENLQEELDELRRRYA